MSENDPTDHPETPRDPATAASDEQQATSSPTEAAGYSKTGGPMAAIRLKWTVRREEDGNYYVDETVGDKSVPIVTGPMSAAAAIRLVDEREQQAVFRFERIRKEIFSRSPERDPPPQTHE